MRTTIIIIKILLIGSLLIIANENLKINQVSDRQVLYEHLYGWFDGLYQKSLGFAGYVIKSDWLPSTPEISKENLEIEK
ncbi:MAG: hypothetical protein KKD18_02770 [Nanoarchaeota archaeon]|nr:hypothetical protein [Nanoarchaeota archaeon]